MSAEKESHQSIQHFSSGEPSALLELLCYCYPLKGQQGKTAIDLNLLTEQLQALQSTAEALPLHEQLQPQLQAPETFATEHYAQLRFVEALLDVYLKHTVFADPVRDALRQLLPLLAIIQLQTPHWSWDWNHPLPKVLSLVQNHFIGWSDHQGKAGQRALTALTTQLEAIRNHWLDDQHPLTLDALEQLLNSEQQRSHKLEQRLKDAETGALRAQRSYQLTAKMLNDKMRGKQLPAAISAFLQGHWRESLRLHLLQNTEQSPEWLRLSKLTETFIWSFQPFNQQDPEQQQRIYQLIPQLQTELQTATTSLAHHPEDLQQQLTLIENEHLKILKAESLSYSDFSLIDDNDPLLAHSTTVSSGLLKQVDRLVEGQWFLKQQDQQRIKLILKLDDAKQLLFTQRTGIKADQYSFEEFAYLLSAKQITALKQGEPLSQSATRLVQKLEQHRQQHLEIKQQRADAQQQQRQHEAAQREKARLKALAEAEQLAAEQAKQEQLRKEAALAAEKTRREAAIKAQQHADHRRENVAQEQLGALNTGARVSFFDELGNHQDCKLAVKIQSSGKYIFTDASGLKAKECLHEELLGMLLNGSAKVVSAGAGFDDTLAKVVNGLRKK